MLDRALMVVSPEAYDEFLNSQNWPLGAALAMQIGGLSMAMGAFLAGVLLSESTFRHQLEADVEPFRGILLGLFFMGVGMSLDLSVIRTDWPLILAIVIGFMALQFAATYLVARLTNTGHAEALTRASLLAMGGEFAFVLYAAAFAVGIFDGKTQAVMTATVILSMALTPLLVMGIRRLLPKEEESFDGIDKAEDLHGRVLVVGFGRFGQIASQPLLLRGVDVSIIDIDIEMIRAAATFGFKVYYGSTPSNLSSVVSVSGPTTTSVVVNGLSSGTYYFSVAAINSSGTESTKSSPASVVVP